LQQQGIFRWEECSFHPEDTIHYYMCGLSAGEYKYAMHGAPVTNAGNSDISENPISFSSFPSPLPSSSQLSSKKAEKGVTAACVPPLDP